MHTRWSFKKRTLYPDLHVNASIGSSTSASVAARRWRVFAKQQTRYDVKIAALYRQQ